MPPVYATNDADIQDYWGWGLLVSCPLQSCLWQRTAVKHFQIIAAYAAVKYRDILIQSLQHAFPLDSLDIHVCKANTLIVHALHIGTWGRDFHLFPLSLLLDRPTFTYVCFYYSDEQRVRTLMLADVDDVHLFVQRFIVVQDSI